MRTLPGALLLLFTALKLTHVIDWSWWWITCPIWGTIVIITLFVILIALLKDKK